MRIIVAIIGLAVWITGASIAFADEAEPSQPASDIQQGAAAVGRDVHSAAKTVGEGAHDVVKTIGHGARDTTKAIGHTTRDFFHGFGDGWKDTDKKDADK